MTRLFALLVFVVIPAFCQPTTFDFGVLGRIEVPQEARLTLERHRIATRAVGTYTLALAITAADTTLQLREADIAVPRDPLGQPRQTFAIIVANQEVITVTGVAREVTEAGRIVTLTLRRGTTAESLIPANRTAQDWPAGTGFEILVNADRLDPLRAAIFERFSALIDAQVRAAAAVQAEAARQKAIAAIREVK